MNDDSRACRDRRWRSRGCGRADLGLSPAPRRRRSSDSPPLDMPAPPPRIVERSSVTAAAAAVAARRAVPAAGQPAGRGRAPGRPRRAPRRRSDRSRRPRSSRPPSRDAADEARGLRRRCRPRRRSGSAKSSGGIRVDHRPRRRRPEAGSTIGRSTPTPGRSTTRQAVRRARPRMRCASENLVLASNLADKAAALAGGSARAGTLIDAESQFSSCTTPAPDLMTARPVRAQTCHTIVHILRADLKESTICSVYTLDKPAVSAHIDSPVARQRSEREDTRQHLARAHTAVSAGNSSRSGASSNRACRRIAFRGGERPIRADSGANGVET